MKKKTLTLLYFFANIYCFGQNIRNEKFGAIKVEDFSPKSNALSSDDAAVILSDVGSSEFVGNNNGWFSLLFKRHKKILIKKATAFDLATVKIFLENEYASSAESLDDLEASSFNLVNGQIVESKLRKGNIVSERFNKQILIKKFTLPDVKEGCIIEYKYLYKAEFSSLPRWDFQDDYPTLWSQYQVTIPHLFNYRIIREGIQNKLILDSLTSFFQTYRILLPNRDAYGLSNIASVSGDAKWSIWVMKDIPAFKKEAFTANPSSNRSKVRFQLYSINYSEDNVKSTVKSWIETSKIILESEPYEQCLNKDKNNWLKKEMSFNLNGLDNVSTAKNIFAFVKNNFVCTDYSAILMSDDPKKICKNKKGSVADINLVLTGLLISYGFEASPVFLSTRGYGTPDPTAAILNQYNYTICQLKIDSILYYLDASDSKNGFNNLPAYCYNGYGRIIAEMPYMVDFSANNLKESKSTVVFIANGDSGKIEASFESKLGFEESKKVREDLLQTSPQEFFKKIAKSYSFDVKTENEEIVNQKNYDEPIAVRYDMKFILGDEDVIYFNPLLTEATKENIFKAEKRNFSVEMPYSIDETYILDMEIPKGYAVDEMPKSVRSKFNDDEGLFEYIIVNKEEHIQLRCKFQLYKANFEATDYESLREFFGLLVKKQAEQIVFKKIK
jgi:hypothetical protein